MTNCTNKLMKLIPFKVEDITNYTSEVPYGVRMIEAPSLWEQGFEGDGVVVAVLDTGCSKHRDLEGRIIDGKNFTSDSNGNEKDYNDLNGHGTHVAGTIAANIGNNIGVAGVAPKANLLICKVLTGSGSGEYSWIIEAIHYAIDWRGPNNERVRVINMSLGGAEDVPELHEAILRAIQNNIAVVVASGNEGDRDENTLEYSYPGAYNEVIEVGAVDQVEKVAEFSNFNLELDCLAPGVSVQSTFPNNTYAKLSGTSMATPHVSGALALLAQANDYAFKRTLTEAELYAQLVKNTVSLGYRKSTEGNGVVKLSIMDKVKTLIEFVRENF